MRSFHGSRRRPQTGHGRDRYGHSPRGVDSEFAASDSSTTFDHSPHHAGPSDEAIFVLASIESQLKLMVESVDKSITLSLETMAKSSKSNNKHKGEVEVHMVNISNMRGAMTRQAQAVRETLRYLESRFSQQMTEYRRILSKNLSNESNLRERVQQLRDEITQRGGDFTQTDLLRLADPREAQAHRQNVEAMLRDIESIRPAPSPVPASPAAELPALTHVYRHVPQEPAADTEGFERDLRELITLRDRLLQQIDGMDQYDQLKRSG